MRLPNTIPVAFVVLAFLFLPWVGTAIAQDIPQEPIATISLEAGKPDTLLVSDLFFSSSYELMFREHDDILVEYLAEDHLLVLTPRKGFEGFTTVSFVLNQETLELPIMSRIKQRHTFKFRPPARPENRMNLMGTFNDWNRSSLPMHDNDGDGLFELELPLDPGQYLYQFVLDELETPDSENPTRVDNGFGGYNSVIQIPPRHTETAYLHILGFEREAGQTKLRFHYEHPTSAEKIGAEDVIALLGNRRAEASNVVLGANDEIAVVVNDGEMGSRSLVRVVVTKNGQASNMQTVRLFDGLPAGAAPGFSTWRDATIYSLMIDRFSDGDPANNDLIIHDSLDARVNYRGGDFQGIIDKLETGYFDSLGVNTLWLSPVNENTNRAEKEWPAPRRYYSGYHGYWPVHHERVEEHFGDLGLLRKLVETAHAHDIKILLDFIANHVHEQHSFFRDHRSWFGDVDLPDGTKNIRRFDEFRLTTWFDTFMPSFDFEGSLAAVEAVSDNAVWWLRETGADGFRHDAVKHIPNRFWRTLTREIKTKIEAQRGRKVYQIGETFGSYDLIGSYVNSGQLDAQFNFNLYDTAIYTFLNPESDFQILARELEKTLAVFGVDHLMGNVMDSHDKTRFMAYADGDIPQNSSDSKEMGWNSPPQVNQASSYEKAKLYLTYMLTIPGVPVLFYGDEFGLTGAADPDNRRMMRFGGSLSALERAMLQDVTKLVSVRNQHSALRYGDFQTLYADPHCFVYLRSDMNERILVVLNKDDSARQIKFELPPRYEVEVAKNLLSEDLVTVKDNRISMVLPGTAGSVWRLDSSR